MSFSACFKLTSHILVASGFLAAAATGEFHPVLLACFGVIFIASWFVDTARVRQKLPTWVWWGMPAAFLITFGLDLGLMTRSFLLSTFHLLFLTASWKLLTVGRDRDYLFLYLSSFAALLLAALLTINPLFLGCLLLFLASGTGACILYEMKRSSAAAQKEGGIQPVVIPRRLRGTGFELFSGFPWRSMAIMTLSLTLSIVAIAIPLFFLLPRISLGIPHRPFGRPQFISGFSERVTLGEIGTIKESNTLVMKVAVDAPPDKLPPDLKWRGIALDHFDGKAWDRGAVPPRTRIPTQAGYFKLQDFARGTDIRVQTFFAEPISSDLVFGSYKMLAVSSDLGLLERDALDNVYSLSPRTSPIRYTVVSDVTRPDPKLFSSDSGVLPGDVQACCLDLPRLDSRISTLAHQVTAGVAEPYDKARALETYLRGNYGYSLELKGMPDSADPLAMFLFGVRRGHCEYFATAMAVMLRQVGIPSRLVNGFRAGDYNHLSNHWTVRQHDAHSWVEAYFPPYGWVEFDPTPGEPARRRPALIEAATGFLDALDLWWSDHVVNYDLRDQSSLLRASWTAIESIKDRGAGFARSAGGSLRALAGRIQPGRSVFSVTGLVVALMGIALLAAAILARRSPALARSLWLAVGPARHRREPEVVVGFFREALELLEHRGWARRPDQTPLEFSSELAGRPFGDALAALTALYNRVRYGRTADPDDVTQARHHLRQLRQKLSERISNL